MVGILGDLLVEAFQELLDHLPVGEAELRRGGDAGDHLRIDAFAVHHRVELGVLFPVEIPPHEAADDVVGVEAFLFDAEFPLHSYDGGVARIGVGPGGAVADVPHEIRQRDGVAHLPAADLERREIAVIGLRQGQVRVGDREGRKFFIRTRPDDVAVAREHPVDAVQHALGTAAEDIDGISAGTNGVSVVALERGGVLGELGERFRRARKHDAVFRSRRSCDDGEFRPGELFKCQLQFVGGMDDRGGGVAARDDFGARRSVFRERDLRSAPQRGQHRRCNGDRLQQIETLFHW